MKEWPSFWSLSLQLREVVDLAVEDDPDRAVFVGDRLVTPRAVDDGEAAHGEADAPVQMAPVLVRPPVADGLAHPPEQLGVHAAVAAAHDPDDSTHRWRPR